MKKTLSFLLILIVFCGCKKYYVDKGKQSIFENYTEAYNAMGPGDLGMIAPARLDFDKYVELRSLVLGEGMLVPVRKSILTNNTILNVYSFFNGKDIYQVISYTKAGGENKDALLQFLEKGKSHVLTEILFSVQDRNGTVIMGDKGLKMFSVASLSNSTRVSKIPRTNNLECPVEYQMVIVLLFFDAEGNVYDYDILGSYCLPYIPSDPGNGAGGQIISIDSALVDSARSCLTSVDRSAMATQIHDLIANECTTRYFYSELLTGQFKFGFCLDTALTGSGRYAAGQDKIFFSTSFAASYKPVLREELFHAYQDKIGYTGGTYQYGNASRGNIEFEALVFAYLSGLNQYGSADVPNVFSPSDLASFKLWAENIYALGNAVDELSLSATPPYTYNYFVQKFSQSKNFNYTSSLTPGALLRVMQHVNLNCPK